MRNQIITFIYIVFFISSYIGQDDNNLVLNSSFESIEGKLKKLSQINFASDWQSPTALKADLFSKSIKGDISVPENIYGKEYPKDGDNYAGILTFSYNNKKPRTYLQTKLIKSLTSGLDYCINVHISLADLSRYAIDNIGIHFSETPLSLDKKGDIIFSDKSELDKVLKEEENKIFKSRYKWEKICGIYQADGKEKYITIGNFYNNKDTKYEKLLKPKDFNGVQLAEAYYYVDKIELRLIDDPSSCNCNNDGRKKRESIIYHLDVDIDESLPLNTKLKKHSIYFDVENYTLDPMFDDKLYNLVKTLKENPELKLSINGHTDNLETEAIKDDPENKKLINLGDYRSKSVKDFLMKNGILSERLNTQNFKSDKPASKGSSMFSMAKNRRVEFIIIE
ncbi:MAG: OmpA family protein [Flavobacteriales bacterium]|nr:OmpA family protein [Flavobacteriales bacterium]